MLQMNLQRSDDELLCVDYVPALGASLNVPADYEQGGGESFNEQPLSMFTGKFQAQRIESPSVHLEKRLFADMRTCGFSVLLQLLDSSEGIEILKNLVVDVEEEAAKYNAQEASRDSLKDLDIPGAIDALETVSYVGELKQIHLKKQRLKRRLSEWAPASYLVVNALNKVLDSAAPGSLEPALVQALKKTIGQFYRYRNRMAQANLRLVYSVANRFRHLGLPFEDLVQEGHLGLIKAIERFDVSKGFRFSTYAHIVISQSIHLALDKQVSLVRLPFKALREKASVDKVRQTLEQSLGRTPHIHELEAHLPDQLEYKSTHIASLVEPNASSQQLYSMPDDAELHAARSVAEEEQISFSSKHATLIEQMLKRLDERESYIVRMRYGIGLGKEFTLEEISQAMGLSRERVRQLANHAVEKLGRIYS